MRVDENTVLLAVVLIVGILLVGFMAFAYFILRLESADKRAKREQQLGIANEHFPAAAREQPDGSADE